jgi:branched-chain amino acid transport system ATP-binding protein
MKISGMTEPLLQIEQLDAYYGKSHILQGVDLCVSHGEMVVVVGRNGMGKTTLLKSILGMPPVSRKLQTWELGMFLKDECCFLR